MRANPLENNLVLWKFEKWIRNTPTASHEWHNLRLQIMGTRLQGVLAASSAILLVRQSEAIPVNGSAAACIR
jgi:hypothetical protein